MIIALLVGLLGGVGAGCRYLLDTVITRRFRAFPVGTCVINISGSLVLGFVAGWGGPLPEVLRLGLGVGFCGGFTTFSTASLETIRLVRTHSRASAVLHLAVMVLGSLAGATAGLLLGRLLS